jgi:hypothetical protein
MGVFGNGWVPSCRQFLVEKSEEARVRHTGERPRVAAVRFLTAALFFLDFPQ